MWLSPHPSALEGLSCPMQKCLLIISSLFLHSQSCDLCCILVLLLRESPDSSFPVLSILCRQPGEEDGTSRCLFISSPSRAPGPLETHPTAKLSLKNIFNPSSLPLVFPGRSPGNLLNKIVLTYTVSCDCAKQLSSAFRNKLLTRIFLVYTQFFSLAVLHEIPVVRPIRGSLKPT